MSVSAGVACFPDDGRTKDELVAVADRALYQVKPGPGRARHARRSVPAGARRDGPRAARSDGPGRACWRRSSAGRRRCSARPMASSTCSTATTSGSCSASVQASSTICGHRHERRRGRRRPDRRDRSTAGVDDYDTWTGRSAHCRPACRATIGVPLTSGGLWSACSDSPPVIAAGAAGPRHRDARQLREAGLDRARQRPLVDVAQRGALYDPTTGLPTASC